MMHLNENYIQMGEGDVSIYVGLGVETKEFTAKPFATITFQNKEKGPITILPDPSEIPDDVPTSPLRFDKKNTFMMEFTNKESIDALMSALAYARAKAFPETK